MRNGANNNKHEKQQKPFGSRPRTGPLGVLTTLHKLPSWILAEGSTVRATRDGKKGERRVQRWE